jgi:hypothetical protein
MDDRQRLTAFVDIADEGLIDLDFVERETLQVAER